MIAAPEPVAVIHTDGACIGSGRSCPGGYAAVIRIGEAVTIVTGRNPSATSAAMELQGVICALEALPDDIPAQIFCDSRYVVAGATERLPWWRSRGWRIVKGGKLANRPLWRRLSELLERRPVAWCWIRSHTGDPGNERAHALAYEQATLSSLEAGRRRGSRRRGLARGQGQTVKI